MLVPTLIFGAVLGTAYVKAKPNRQAPPDPMVAHVFRQALDARLPPDGYRKLAAFMTKWGYFEEAKVLTARATYGELPDATKAQHNQWTTQALQSQDPALVQRIADNLYHQGAIASGLRLRRHAAALAAAAKITPVEPPPPPAGPVQTDPASGPAPEGAGPSQEAPVQQAAE